MTEFLLKNSDAVAAVIIYQEKQSDSLENALIRVSNVLNIRYNRPSFDYLKHCLKINFQETCIQNNKKDIHYCILYEFVQNKPWGQSFKTIREVLGEGIVEYEEFKRLFKCFERGMFEMEENKLSVDACLSNVSKEVMEKIVQHLDIKDRLNFQKVSKVIRRKLNNSHLTCESISLNFANFSTELRIENLPPIIYKQGKNQCHVEFKNNVKTLIGQHHFYRGIMDAGTIFENKTLELESLKISFSSEIRSDGRAEMENVLVRCNKLKEYFGTFKRLVHAKSFDFQLKVPLEKDEKSDTILSILPYLKPGFLEKIRIEIKSDCSEMMRKVVELDQWKLAIELDMCDTPFKLSLQNLIHFKRFSVFMPNISESHVTWLARILPENDTFEYCSIRYPDNQLNLDLINLYITGRHSREESNSLLETNAVYEMQLGKKSIDFFRKF
ncbi:hypothetical protein CRE_08699 [Caenorhabditis remanei]|uniref:F-box domain-containing protein n=1 Tax=Caenorhabditis remanei TaxID=31234 RepID=E3LJE8_CAERE|nr:hypothetical protein CRE_08699 [Caenorhabditis remanei]